MRKSFERSPVSSSIREYAFVGRRTWLSLAIVAVIASCSSSDNDLKKALRLEFAVDVDPRHPHLIRFGLRCEAIGERVYFGRRPVIVHVNGQPRTARGKEVEGLRGFINPTGRQVRYWYIPKSELQGWLGSGSPAKCELIASIGPAQSNAVTIDLPTFVIDSPSIESIRR